MEKSATRAAEGLSGSTALLSEATSIARPEDYEWRGETMAMIGGLLIAIAVLASLVFVTVWLLGMAASRSARRTAAHVGDRVDAREGRRLKWCCPPDDIAKALIADQPVYFWVHHRRALRRRRVEYLFVPLSCVRLMGPGEPAPPATAWHVWQSSSGEGCTVRVPASGWEIARRVTPGPADAVAVRETLDTLMHRVHDHRWGDPS